MPSILENLLRIYETKKDDPFIRYGIAIEYRNAGEMAKALEFFENVHRDFPEYVPNYYHYAEALAGAGRNEEARSIYGQGIAAAKKANDAHALSELMQALELLD